MSEKKTEEVTFSTSPKLREFGTEKLDLNRFVEYYRETEKWKRNILAKLNAEKDKLEAKLKDPRASRLLSVAPYDKGCLIGRLRKIREILGKTEVSE